MRNEILAVAGLAIVSLACAKGEPVALNERLFAIQSMESQGGGCTMYNLGSGEQSGLTSGGGEFTVSQRLADDIVVVEVKRGATLLATKRYDESFFRGGALDEFVAPSALGNDLRLRYWGAFHPNGIDGCAPLEDDGPR